MTSREMNTKIENMASDIQRILQKISNLENSRDSMNQKLTNEINKRQALEKHTITTQEAFSGQLQVLKEASDRYENLLKNSMEKSRLSILEEVQKKNTKLLQLVESSLNSDKYFRNENPNQIDQGNNINSNYYQNTDSQCYTSKQVDDKFEDIEKLMENEFNQYRTELNENVLKANFVEKKMYELYEQQQMELNNFKKEMNGIKREISGLMDFKKECNSNFNKYQKDFIKNDNIINQFHIRVDTLINDIESKLGSYEEIYDNQNEIFSQIKKDVYNQINNMNLNSGNNLKQIGDGLIEKMGGYHKEIDNFEEHMLDEHKKFIEYIETHWDEQNAANRKLYDYLNKDVEILKNKNETIESLMKKLRADVFKALNDSEEFLEKKYESIFRLMNK